MKRGKYEVPRAPKRRSSKKAMAMLLSLVLVIGCVVGGTLAWLTAESTEVKNTFSTSTIGVDLKETTTEYKMIPGWDIAKDPKAWVTDGSEAAYLFVEIKESANFDTFMTYAIADGWTLLNSNPAQEGSGIVTDDTVDDTYVIYREVTAEQMGEGNAFAILKDNKVTVKGEEVTKEMMNALKADDPATEENESTYPTLTFTAYAHQLYQNEELDKFEAATAWGNVSK